VRRLATAAAPVLVTGETGTGKEVVARQIAELGPRAAQPFIALNCGSLSRNLIESELFGHERGAFTGAVQRKEGAFEAAHRGTLFLDEVGELPAELQPQLLRVLESGEVRRVGSTEAFAVDVRVIAATNRDLAAEVMRGAFREDLFHRLHVLTLELPPLRARGDDVKLLAQYFLEGFAPPGQRLSFSPAALAKLSAHVWPGNVRELRNVVQRAVLLRRGDVVDAEDVTFPPSTLASRVETESAVSGRTLQEIEKAAIVAELRRFKGNKKEAAAALGVSRSTIHRKIDEYAIDADGLTPP
jgi:DNA-binding NtrC family response regulator